MAVFKTYEMLSKAMQPKLEIFLSCTSDVLVCVYFLVCFSVLTDVFFKNMFNLGEVIVFSFQSHDNFITEMKHSLPLQSDQYHSTSFTFISESLVKGDPLVMH